MVHPFLRVVLTSAVLGCIQAQRINQGSVPSCEGVFDFYFVLDRYVDGLSYLTSCWQIHIFSVLKVLETIFIPKWYLSCKMCPAALSGLCALDPVMLHVIIFAFHQPRLSPVFYNFWYRVCSANASDAHWWQVSVNSIYVRYTVCM